MTCFQKNLSNGTIEVLEEDNCSQEKPEIEEECEAENPCGSVDWLVTDWSGCPETCGKFSFRTWRDMDIPYFLK